MTTFEFEKPIEGIEQPLLIPVDWCDVEVTEEPILRANSALYELASKEGVDLEQDKKAVDSLLKNNSSAGHNLVIKARTEHKDSRFDGRQLTMWLPYPSKYDMKRYDSRGRNVYKQKRDRIEDFVDKFGGSIDENTMTILPGMKGCVYVTQQRSRMSEDMENSIAIFTPDGGSPFKKYGE
uniref:Uncharacterized protein n=1 Tax=viral metagenome TaxID=1070528 RepID=A0A6M3L346_9ZZZZ